MYRPVFPGDSGGYEVLGGRFRSAREAGGGLDLDQCACDMTVIRIRTKGALGIAALPDDEPPEP